MGQLIADLEDANAKSRTKAIETFASTRDPRAVGPLIAALKDSDTAVRESARTALGGIKDPRAVEPLIKVLNAHGDKAMAEGDLRSKDPALEVAVRRWATAHGYEVRTLFAY